MRNNKANSLISFEFIKSASPMKTIFWSGLVAGILDAIAGVIVYYIFFGLNPLQVLQFIAAGVYGPGAINGGVGMILAGTFYHFLIAYVVAIIYFIAYPKIKLLRTNIVLMGLIYGLGIWLIMNLFVLPNSNIPKGPFDAGLAIVGIVWHMVLVGLPIAWITSKHFITKR
ncbi:MAG TPA: DUF1440 domain-containing protein [Muricauda sp.]|nr:DUF1440 domain-containing protein [uncultured Allomuricauda sp.]MBC74258.1 DUF1440 domain-containing protein [Allomuricauda sp.]HBU76569.1 DUF1440 domain-containing protein [Allomuricauda sp.]|tara:strand:+ start:17918 stop:18427 length:510 start_codon:yes stop_codon:yes gene_type:complete